MKYDEELNNIIFKYKLDDGYPLFQKKISAEKYIHRLICQWKAALNEDQKMLCIAATEDQILHIRFYTYGDDRFDYITYVILDRLLVSNRRRICVETVPEEIYLASYPLTIFDKDEVFGFLGEDYRVVESDSSSVEEEAYFVDGKAESRFFVFACTDR